MKTTHKSNPRNEHARALHLRAANANVAIRVDTRPKLVKPKKGRSSYRRAHKQECLGAGSTGPEAFEKDRGS